MLKALLYKEWLKIRWAAILSLLVFAAVIIKMNLYMSYAMRVMNPSDYWYEVIIRGILFFNDFHYLPLLAGIIIGATQFFPEIDESRLKLTLHLPMRENSILLFMAFFGAFVVLSIVGLSLIVISFITIAYFPMEVMLSMWMTFLPWILAGLAGYFATITVFVEPIWIKRIILVFISYAYIDVLVFSRNFNLYEQAIGLFIIVSMFFSISIIYSGSRFHKGVMR